MTARNGRTPRLAADAALKVSASRADRQPRVQERGFIGRQVQSPPMLFTRDGHTAFLGDSYRGCSAFLICSGPSLRSHDLSLRSQRGALMMSVNNAATVVRTQLWTCVDDPASFSDAIWYDPAITKFVPMRHMKKSFMVRDASDQLERSADKVGDMPCVYGYHRNDDFVAERWLHEDTFNWGNNGRRVDAHGIKGSRSVMLVAVRLLYYLGVRTVYLLGCDFHMQVGAQNYAFPQDRTPGSVHGNNYSYNALNVRFAALRPHFEQHGFFVHNCTPNSGLTAFDYLPYEEAVAAACARIPKKINTVGMYDRKAKEKAAEAAKHIPEAAEQPRHPPVVAPPAPVAGRKPGIPRTKSTAAPGNCTLVTTLDEPASRHFAQVSSRWAAVRPELMSLPAIVAHDPALAGRLTNVRGPDSPPMRALPWDCTLGVTRDGRRFHGLFSAIAKHVETEWCLFLDPEVLPTDDLTWWRPELFMPDDRGRQPALIGPPLVFSSSPERLTAWNNWGNGLDCFRSLPGLPQLPSKPNASSRQPPLTQWCFFVRTQWAREVTTMLETSPMIPEDDWFLPYMAARRCDFVVNFDPTLCGWEYCGGQPRRLSRLAASNDLGKPALVAG